MIDNIVALGYGIIVLGLVIGVGSVVLFNLGSATAGCGEPYATYNSSADKCQNSTGSQITPPGKGWVNSNYVLGQIGQSGLAGWLPAIIAIAVGLMFLGYFAVGKKKY